MSQANEQSTHRHPADDGHERGRGARRPNAIGRRGWKDILLRTKEEIGRDRVSMVAASVAFYGMLAVFPAMIAMISVYGLFADPEQVQSQVASLSGLLPPSARELLVEQLDALVASGSTTLGLGLVLSLLGSLWSASAGMKAVMQAINIAYDEEEARGFFKLRGLAILLTLGSLIVVLAAIALVAALPALFGMLGLGSFGQTLVTWGRWPLMALVVVFWLAVLYRVAPCRTRPLWRWVSWGAVLSTALWLGATALFSFYVTHFGSYQETYGAVGGVIVFLLWLYLSAFVVLLGAELDSEIEHQTAQDSTIGEPKPMGERGARKADTLGRPLGASGPESHPA